MGKIKQWVSTAWLRVGNTIATPVRRWGEILNAWANIPRQWISGLKNIAEVTKQTGNALVHNFLNFSKVQGKWYQRFLKGSMNLASAVTRRPVMIAGAGMASALNQWIRQPFKKLLYTPGKMFKWMRNATRIFSKKKGFDFQTYDTHETGWDTWVNQIQEKSFGFLGATWWSSTPAESETPKAEIPKNEDVSWGTKEKKSEEKPDQSSDKKPDSTPPSTPSDNPPASWNNKQNSIDEIKKKNKEETEAKDQADQENLSWKTMDDTFKKEYIKDYEKVLGWKASEESILERGKKNKKWDNIDQIIIAVKKENPTIAGYFEEILSKKAPTAQAA